MTTNTNTAPTLTWTRPELLADATAWSCKDNAIANLRDAGRTVSNDSVADFCAGAIKFLSTCSSSSARALLVGYTAVRMALGVAS